MARNDLLVAPAAELFSRLGYQRCAPGDLPAAIRGSGEVLAPAAPAAPVLSSASDPPETLLVANTSVLAVIPAVPRRPRSPPPPPPRLFILSSLPPPPTPPPPPPPTPPPASLSPDLNTPVLSPPQSGGESLTPLLSQHSASPRAPLLLPLS